MLNPQTITKTVDNWNSKQQKFIRHRNVLTIQDSNDTQYTLIVLDPTVRKGNAWDE